MQPHRLQHTRLPCPSLSLGVCSHSCAVSDDIQPSHPCHPLLLLPSIFPSIGVFSNELALCISWPKYWPLPETFSPQVILSHQYPIYIFLSFQTCLREWNRLPSFSSGLFLYIHPLASFFPHPMGTSSPFSFNSLCFLHSFLPYTTCFLKTSLPVRPEF